MTKIDELELFANFVGRRINYDRLAALGKLKGCGKYGYSDCAEYRIALKNIDNFGSNLKISPAMLNRWKKDSAEIVLHIFAKEDRITGGHIRKTVRANSSGCERYETDPNGGELKIIKTILEFLSETEINEKQGEIL